MGLNRTAGYCHHIQDSKAPQNTQITSTHSLVKPQKPQLHNQTQEADIQKHGFCETTQFITPNVILIISNSITYISTDKCANF
jgi:hypothetical protein